jgi:hypothetical protein
MSSARLCTDLVTAGQPLRVVPKSSYLRPRRWAQDVWENLPTAIRFFRDRNSYNGAMGDRLKNSTKLMGNAEWFKTWFTSRNIQDRKQVLLNFSEEQNFTRRPYFGRLTDANLLVKMLLEDPGNTELCLSALRGFVRRVIGPFDDLQLAQRHARRLMCFVHPDKIRSFPFSERSPDFVAKILGETLNLTRELLHSDYYGPHMVQSRRPPVTVFSWFAAQLQRCLIVWISVKAACLRFFTQAFFLSIKSK